MRKFLEEIHYIAQAPMSACPRGMERGWLNIVLQALTHTYRLQERPQPDIPEADLAKLFDRLATQWLQMKNIALARGILLDPTDSDITTIDELRLLFLEAEALNILFPDAA